MHQEGWSPTVKPPKLGGNTRMGVFATRSPFRPNPLGLSSVQLLRMEKRPGLGTVLVISGADLMDGSPIYDIKPYLSFTDSHPDAKNGFAEVTETAFSEGVRRAVSEKYGLDRESVGVVIRGFSPEDMRSSSITVVLGEGSELIDYRAVRDFVAENFTRGGDCEVIYG